MNRGLAAGVRLAVTTLLLLGAAALGWAPPAAYAAPPTAYVSVSIDRMDPALPEPDGKVRLQGVVTNTSDSELLNLQVAFWRSADAIADDEGMTAALESAANVPVGKRVDALSNFQRIPSDTDRTLAPGETTPFDVSIDVARFGFTDKDTSYLIGVQVRGQTEVNGRYSTLGRGRIFMTLVNKTPTNTLRMTTVVIITSRPAWVRSGVLADDHLAEELAPGGRLQALITAAGRAATSFAIDPALVQEIETMRDGYQVLTSDGQTQEGTGQSAATLWLNALENLIEKGDGFRLLYGHPDVAALVHNDRSDLLRASAAAGAAVAATEDLPLLVLPTNGRADAQVAEAAEALRPEAILLSDNSAKGPGPLLRGVGSAPIVSFTSAALQGGPGPAPRGTAVKVRQLMLADTWLEATDSAPDATIGRVRLITNPSQAVAAGPDGSVPWLRPSTLSDLLDGLPSDWDENYRYTATARRAELPAAQLVGADQLVEDYRTYSDLMVTAAPATAEGRAVVTRAASSSWRGQAEAQTSYLNPIQARVRGILTESVAITSNPRVLTTGREATFPITVRNALPGAMDAEGVDRNAIAVTITFDSGNSSRLTVAPLVLKDPIGGKSSVTENADVEAKANGTVRVVARLVTKSGRQVGKPLPIEVTATQAGTTGWIIAIAAGVVLLGTTGLRIRQVTRERATAAAGHDPAGGPGSNPTPVVVSRPPMDVGGASDPPQDSRGGRDVETLDV